MTDLSLKKDLPSLMFKQSNMCQRKSRNPINLHKVHLIFPKIALPRSIGIYLISHCFKLNALGSTAFCKEFASM